MLTRNNNLYVIDNMHIYHSLIGISLSYLYSTLILPKQSKQYPLINITTYPMIYNGMIIIPISKYKAIHIHHYMIYFVLLFLYKYLYLFIWYFFLGLTLQGLFYNDRFDIICDNPYN